MPKVLVMTALALSLCSGPLDADEHDDWPITSAEVMACMPHAEGFLYTEERKAKYERMLAMGPDGIPPMRAALFDKGSWPGYTTPWRIIEAFRLMGGDMDPARAVVKDFVRRVETDPEYREYVGLGIVAEAARTLAVIGTHEDVPFLLEYVPQGDYYFNTTVLQGIAQLATVEQIPAFEAAVTKARERYPADAPERKGFDYQLARMIATIRGLPAESVLRSMAMGAFALSSSGAGSSVRARGSSTLAFERAPPTVVVSGNAFEVTAACTYDAGMAPGSRWEYSGLSITFHWEAVSGGQVTGTGSSQTGTGGGSVSYQSTRSITFHAASIDTNDKTVRVRARVTGKIIDYGDDKVKGTADDQTHVIDHWTLPSQQELTAFHVAVELRRQGSGDAFRSSATLAVGGKNSAVHNADVRITVTPVPEETVTLPIALGGPAALGGDDGVKPMLVVGGESFTGPGKYLIDFEKQTTTGMLRSGSEAGDCMIGNATARIAWDHGEDVHERWTYAQFFEYDSYDPVSYRLELAPGVGIPGHDIRFEVTQISYVQFDPDTWEWVEHTGVVTALEAYSSFADTAQGEGDGIVTSAEDGTATAYQIVHGSPTGDWTIFVYDVSFSMTDESAWR